MKKKDVVIVGCGSFAELIYGYIEEQADYCIKGFTVQKEYIDNDTFCNLPVYCYESIENELSPRNTFLILAIGYREMNRIKEKLFSLYLNKGYTFLNYIHSSAIISPDVIMGRGNIILEGVIIGRNCTIGNGNLIWSGVVFSHNDTIGDYNNIAPGVVFAGDCSAKDRNFLGVNSMAINGLSIGNGNMIGAGACLTHSLSDEKVYVPPRGTILRNKSPKDMTV